LIFLSLELEEYLEIELDEDFYL